VIHFRRIADDNDEPTERGTYRRVREYWDEHFGPRGKPNPYWAEICCPGCGRVALVGQHHVVSTDGTVTPSDVCPYDAAWAQTHGQVACTFHKFIVLDDWDRPCTPRRSP